jgi:hypothetical protein
VSTPKSRCRGAKLCALFNFIAVIALFRCKDCGHYATLLLSDFEANQQTMASKLAAQPSSKSAFVLLTFHLVMMLSTNRLIMMSVGAGLRPALLQTSNTFFMVALSLLFPNVEPNQRRMTTK